MYKGRISIFTIIAVFIIFLVLLVSFKWIYNSNFRDTRDDSDILYFKYEYGGFDSGYTSYEIYFKDDSYLFIKDEYSTKISSIEKEVELKKVLKLEDLTKKDRIKSWNGFSEVEANISEGYSFNLEIIYKDGNRIEATGKMKYPNSYKEVHADIIQIMTNMEK